MAMLTRRSFRCYFIAQEEWRKYWRGSDLYTILFFLKVLFFFLQKSSKVTSLICNIHRAFHKNFKTHLKLHQLIFVAVVEY